MFLLHCSAKLRKAAKISDSALAAANHSDAGEQWYADLVRIGTKKHVIFIHNPCRFVVVALNVRAPQLKALPAMLRESLARLLVGYQVPESCTERYLSALEEPLFAKSSDKSLIGSLNDMIRSLKFSLERGGPGFEDSVWLGKHLNETPMRAAPRGFFPDREFGAYLRCGFGLDQDLHLERAVPAEPCLQEPAVEQPDPKFKLTELAKILLRDFRPSFEFIQGMQSILAGEDIPDFHFEKERTVMIGELWLSHLARTLLTHPLLDEYRRRYEAELHEYKPGYPPASPVTSELFQLSFFTSVKVTDEGDTLASLSAILSRDMSVPDEIRSVVARLTASRLGLYHCLDGWSGSGSFEELISGKRLKLRDLTYYPAVAGEIWLGQILPWAGTNYMLGVPYVVRKVSRTDMEACLHRLGGEAGRGEQGLSSVFEADRQRRFWLDYVRYGYLGATDEAIFLTGVPDIPETQPCSPAFVEAAQRQ